MTLPWLPAALAKSIVARGLVVFVLVVARLIGGVAWGSPWAF